MWNWGRNLQCKPRLHLRPASELELLEALRQHCARKIRPLGSLHSWSDVAMSDDVVVSLDRLVQDSVIVTHPDGTFTATVPAGWQIRRLLEVLGRHQSPLTLPTVGAIKRQTIAGAISTGTHGSGASSLSHYVRAVRIASYSRNGMPVIHDIDAGTELSSARCSLGYMGIIVAVTLECIAAHDIEETLAVTGSQQDVLDPGEESEYPLQQFVLFPFAWKYYVLRRRVDRGPRAGTVRRWLCTRAYRVYKLVAVDFFTHLIIKLLALVPVAWLTRGFFHVLSRTVLTLPRLVLLLYQVLWPRSTFVDTSEHILTLRHYLWRHMEMEVFVPAQHIREALDLARYITDAFAGRISGAPIDQRLRQDVEQAMGTFRTYTHHYPITCRRVERDDTLVSMTSGRSEAWATPTGSGDYYTLSFFNYGTRYEQFSGYCTVLAKVLIDHYRARLHWGKFIPPECRALLRKTYPASWFDEFERACFGQDPNGVFRNAYAREVLRLP
jgi:hypothetical protein